MTATLEAIARAIAAATLHRRVGTLLHSNGETAVAAGINLAPGELAFIEDPSGNPVPAQAAGAAPGVAHLALLERTVVPAGARVLAAGTPPLAPVGHALLGRIVDGLGRPIDGSEPPASVRWVPASAEPPHPLDREPIARPLPTGVRAIDGFLTLGRGQRVGIFAGSGVGKSTLLGMLARGTRADVAIIALIGERGREVRDFIEHDLGREALRASVVVASTGDNPAAMRICAARTATAIAEGFRDEGADVLLLFDSLTRVAMARREIGLAAGEPPTARGYPPSVFSMLPHLMERAGPGARGSITAVYTVLVDGDDMDEPIADLARATLDGHIVLRRTLASAGHYPPIDVLQSVSRLVDRVASPQHREAAHRLRQLLAAYEDARDLIAIGAYSRGADPLVDRALELLPALNTFLRQRAEETTPFDDAVAALSAIDPAFEPAQPAAASDALEPEPTEVTDEPSTEAPQAADSPA
jgi:FliI/YscN family ATPase